MNPVYAVIVAGGSGARMGTTIPKQFLELCGRPVLYHTIKAFLTAIPEVHIILVLPEQHISYAQIVVQSFSERIELTIVMGGDTRYASVQNGIKEIPEDALVMVQDGVRPLLSTKLIHRCIEKARDYGSAIPVIPAADSMRMIGNDGASLPVRRDALRIVQTPQTFKANILLPAFKAAYREEFTDEATVVAANGGALFYVAGEKRNIKITTPEDLIIATALMQYYSSEETDK